MTDSSFTDEGRRFAVEVVRRLREAGFEALWAGGCVRDQLLGWEPSDYDVATSARPEQVRECFGYRRTLAIGASFGVITVLGNRRQGQIEVATFRSDASYSDGRHPDSVTFSSASEDARRRDFTMNGLFFDPLTGQVIDYVGGRADLEAGIVRAIGDPYQRIAEDKLRMLRAVRFAATFSFRLDPTTQAAIAHEAQQIQIVSAERIAGELRKMLVHPQRVRAVQLLRDVGLLTVILPEARVLWEPFDGTSGEARAADWQRTLAVLAGLADPPFRVPLAALLWGVQQRHSDPQCVAEICARWRLSNHEHSGAQWLLGRQAEVRAARQIPWPRLQRILVAPAVDELLQLAAAISRALDEDGLDVVYCRDRLRLPRSELDPPPLITGDDLKQAGFRAGPGFRTILERVRDAQLERRIGTRQEALRLAAEVRDDEGRSEPH